MARPDTVQSEGSPAEWASLSPTNWKWLDDVRILLQGKSGRQNFINTLTDTKTSNVGIKTLFINDTQGDARFSKPTGNAGADEPYIGPSGEMIVPSTIIASSRQILNVSAMRAYQTAPQTFFSGAPAVMTFGAKAFDQDNAMILASGSFTPIQSGTYMVTGAVGFDTGVVVANKSVSIGIAKNGVTLGSTEQHTSNALFPLVVSANCLVAMNGTTDYLTMAVQQNFGVNSDTMGNEYTCYMTAFKVD